MDKALKLYNSKGAFPSVDDQIEVFGFKYDAKRMGGAPIMTVTVMYGSCLDEVWTDDVYVELNGEKYYLKQTPTSSFSNTDARYKHECEFVSERIKLDNVYFFDTVVGDPQGYDKPISNSSVFSFFGNIREFAKRLNASLQYSRLQTKNDDGTYSGYVVIVNNDVDDEEKLLSFSNVPFSTALQESYNQFEIPYYFVGKEIHFGYWQEVIEEPFRYGVDKELLSITKTNANQKVITRCTGIGGTENIPYYYPNTHPQGELIPLYNNAENVLSVEDEALFAKNILLTDKVVYAETRKTDIALGANSTFYNIYDYNKWAKEKGRNADWRKDSNWFVTPNLRMPKPVKEKYATASMGGYEPYKDTNEYVNFNKDNPSIAFRIALNEGELSGKSIKITMSSDEINFDDATTNPNGVKTHIDYDVECYVNAQGKYAEDDEETGSYVTFGASVFGSVERRDGKAIISFEYKMNDAWWDKSIYIVVKKRSGFIYNSEIDPKNPVISADNIGVTAHIDFNAELVEPIISYHWVKNDRYYSLSDLGLSNVSQPMVGDTITFKQSAYVQPMPNLMPPVYWGSEGAERFYNAKKYPFAKTYEIEHIYQVDGIWHNELGEYEVDGYIHNNAYKDENSDYYTFPNPYSDSKRVEHIVEFPDIKPTIEGMTNNAGQPINAFLEFAYDKDDNDAIDKDGNYIHPYFYAKLPKFDSFNLFTHANEKGEVTFSMKSGNCGACNFVLGVNSESGKNDLQVDNSGKLLFENGVAKRGAPQDRQNDTKNNEVWVALKKDNSTFGTIMPSAQHGYYPAAGDTFVLLNITMPIEYVKAAENRLKEEIIKYMYENNVEKFSFSIKFSRIYLAENPQILKPLNENAFIKVEYNGKEYPLYVNSFAYKMTAGEALPEITIELAETLSASMNAIQAAVSQVRTDVLDRVQKMDIAAMVAANFLSKNSEDYAKQKITFNRGLSVGSQDAEVAKIDQMGHAEIESATLKQYISSPTFRDGFSGEGFKMWLDEKGLSYLTVDVLTARQRMVIYEMLVEKSRSVNGGLWVSSANGRISDVVDNIDNYEIYFEDINTFVKGDYMRCQVYTGADMKSYWVEVSSVDGGVVLVSKEEFAPYNTLPQIGDDVFLCGSKNVNRQNAIHISATEDGQPRISIYNGISTKSLAGCLRTQLGNLDNIDDDVLKPQGDGLYSDNAYLKGEFVLKNTGESVETKFEVTDGNIKSAVGTLQNDNEHGKTILYNPSFTKGEDGWITSNVVIYYLMGDTPIFNQGQLVYNNAHENTDPDYNNHRFILNISDGYIKQLNEYFVNKPDIARDTLVPISLNLKMMVEDNGVLLTYIDGCDMDATKAKAFCGVCSSDYNEDDTLVVDLGNGTSHAFTGMDGWEIKAGDVLAVEIADDGIKLYNLTQKGRIIYNEWRDEQYGHGEPLTEPIVILGCKSYTASEDYLQIEFNSRWNGTGNFNLAFSGGASVYSLQLFTNETEVRYATLFEQTEKLLKLSAMNFNEDGTIKEESGIVVQSEGAGLYARNDEGKQAKVATYADGVVTLEGEHIQLKGNVTANGNVRIDDEGKLHAKDGEFEGKVTAKEGKIAEFEISENGLTYEAGAYTASFTKEAFVLGGEIEYSGLVGRTKTFTVRGEDSINDVSPLITAERKLSADEQIFANVPIFRIQDNSNFPTVAIETTGAIHCNGGLIQRGAWRKLENANSPNVISPLKSTFWIVSNNYQVNAFILLPNLAEMRMYLDLGDSDTFAIPMEILNAGKVGGYNFGVNIAISSEESETAYQYKFIEQNGNIQEYISLGFRSSIRLALIYDGETYYAQILSKTT